MLFFIFTGVVCQEEDISLLTPAFKELLQLLESKPPVTETKMVFTASSQSSSWIGDLKRAGFPSFAGISRLHMLYEMFGELKVKEAKLTRDGDSTEMVATLLTKDNRYTQTPIPIPLREVNTSPMFPALKTVTRPSRKNLVSNPFIAGT